MTYLEMAAETANPEQAVSVWESTQSILAKAKLSDQQQRALAIVLGNSNFLARWVRRYPEEALQVLQQDWRPNWKIGELETKQDPKDFFANLIQYKYQQLFRITLRDMGLGLPFPEIGAELSALARLVIQQAYEYLLNQCHQSMGVPQENSKNNIPFSILGMGKLGGNELNFSSDVDLIYFYGTDKGQAIKDKTSTSPHAFFTKLGERLGQGLQQRTGTGFLYRVDLELRPEGIGGPLVNSFDAMADYYENFGAFWEKQAMIKAQCAAGSQILCKQLLQELQPFVYPKIADYTFLEKTKEMKERLLASLQKSSQSGYHVKLGKGGIREIEFFVQSFQILFGGKYPALQTSNTLEAVGQLAQNKLITPEVEQHLTEAYLFLRTLENRLQQVEEQQTHRLPEDETSLRQLACRMGYGPVGADRSYEQLEQDLNRHRNFVETTFNGLLARESNT